MYIKHSTALFRASSSMSKQW